jgi:ATP-binding protein involved in chromosome partitioning
MSISKEQVTSALRAVTDPVSGKDLITADMVRGLTLDGTKVSFVLEIDPARASEYDAVKSQVQTLLKTDYGVETVNMVLTAHATKAPPPDIKPKKPAPAGPQSIPGVKRVIAVASGKGGVGKSTVSVNLACALAAMGVRVGLLDADVYGPSQPRMLGATGRPASPDGKTIIPLEANGVKVMSMGFMVDADQAVVWRGPMLMGALQQMLFQVAWGDLDLLIVDLPPGTGDVQLTLSQKSQLDGAIVVSTPQDIALLDARRGIAMFNQLKTPILGLVENMSTHICSNCGHEEHIFGHGGVRAEAAKLGVPVLAEVPLHIDIRTTSDAGTPIVVKAPSSAQAQAFFEIAKAVKDGVLSA